MRADDDLIEAIAERVERRLARSSRMVAQYGSPLGPRTHRAAVNRRIERGEGGASIVEGKRIRFLLTQEALQEELDRQTKAYRSRLKGNREIESSPSPRRGRRPRDQSPELDALQRELTGGLRTLREVR